MHMPLPCETITWSHTYDSCVAFYKEKNKHNFKKSHQAVARNASRGVKGACILKLRIINVFPWTATVLCTAPA